MLLMKLVILGLHKFACASHLLAFTKLRATLGLNSLKNNTDIHTSLNTNPKKTSSNNETKSVIRFKRAFYPNRLISSIV